MSLFYRDKDQYYKQYILGESFEPNEKMLLGSVIHAYLEDPKYDLVKKLKELGISGKRLVAIKKAVTKAEVKKLSEQEVIMVAELKGIKLLVKVDGFDKKCYNIDDYKTTDTIDKYRRWSQWRADKDEQMSFYALVHRLAYYKYPRVIRILELHTVKGTCKVFETVRGPQDLKLISEKIIRCVNELKMLGWWERRLSRRERETKNQVKMVL